jgi:hypothetical protein
LVAALPVALFAPPFGEARWRLGQMLAKMERQKVSGGGRAQLAVSRAGKSLMEEYRRIGLDKNRASEAQRIGSCRLRSA